jgi:PhnB protein
MASRVKPVPMGYHTATPYLIVQGAANAIEFYKKAFGATELMRMTQPDGRIGHAEIKIGDSPILLADEFPEMDARSPQSFGGSPVQIYLYVEDVDRVFSQATAAGAKVLRPVQGSVLWRPLRRGEGPLRTRLVHRNTHGGRGARRTAEARRGRWTRLKQTS